MPEGAIYVGRGSRWGNPFSVDVVGHAVACGLMTYGAPGGPDTEQDILSSEAWALHEAEIAVSLYRRFIELLPDAPRAALLEPLRGHDLACWCSLAADGKPVPCHADVLIEIANG